MRTIFARVPRCLSVLVVLLGLTVAVASAAGTSVELYFGGWGGGVVHSVSWCDGSIDYPYYHIIAHAAQVRNLGTGESASASGTWSYGDNKTANSLDTAYISAPTGQNFEGQSFCVLQDYLGYQYYYSNTKYATAP